VQLLLCFPKIRAAFVGYSDIAGGYQKESIHDHDHDPTVFDAAPGAA